jgi:activator of HSP90 ATPase
MRIKNKQGGIINRLFSHHSTDDSTSITANPDGSIGDSTSIIMDDGSNLSVNEFYHTMLAHLRNMVNELEFFEANHYNGIE